MYDEKIINNLIDNFENANPGNNLYLIYKAKPFGEYQYVKRSKNVIKFNPEADDLGNIIQKTQNVRAIICHVLAAEFAHLLIKLNKKITIFWVIWGYDLYLLPKIQPHIYAPETKKVFFKLRKKDVLNWLLFGSVFNKIIQILDPTNTHFIIQAAHHKVDYCISFIEEDFLLYKHNYPKNKISFFYSNLLSIEQYVGAAFLNQRVIGNDILIGNSNSIESNHLDVFRFLSKRVKSENKLYVPLSYGADEKYKNLILKRGKRIFGDMFIPMIDFLTLDKYVSIQLNCGIGIFFHYRQQAMGNIIAMLWLGARIYMSARNPAYNYFRRIGIAVFDLLTEFDIYGLKPLTEDVILNNRLILNSYFSKEQVAENYRNLIYEIYK